MTAAVCDCGHPYPEEPGYPPEHCPACACTHHLYKILADGDEGVISKMVKKVSGKKKKDEED